MMTIDSEIQRFNRLGATWWDPRGPMRPLHVVNELRLKYVTDQVMRQFARHPSAFGLDGLRILDVGCGGGLLSEPLARMGAKVVYQWTLLACALVFILNCFWLTPRINKAHDEG